MSISSGAATTGTPPATSTGNPAPSIYVTSSAASAAPATLDTTAAETRAAIAARGWREAGRISGPGEVPVKVLIIAASLLQQA
jgi:hypothetical protein